VILYFPRWSPRRPAVSIGGCGSASHVLGRDDELFTCPSTTFIDLCNIIGYLVSRFLHRRRMIIQLFSVGFAISYKGDVGDQPACPDQNELVD
jgi:hypothetical protein